MDIKNNVVSFIKRKRMHLESLQEARFDRGEKEILRILDDDSLKDSFPAPLPFISFLIWFFILLFPLILILDPSSYFARDFKLARLAHYYVPLILTLLVFWINQKFTVRHFFFKRKYLLYFVCNFGLIFICLFIREIMTFMMERSAGDTWFDFFSSYCFSQTREHFSIWTVVSFSIFVLMVCICSIFISIFTRQTIRAFLIREQRRSILETELVFLKQQLSPHFLFNTLNNMSSRIFIDPKLAEKSMTKLSQLLRITLYQTGDKFITLKEELDILEKYADLESLRHDENFEFTFEKKIEDSSKIIEPLLLMPLLENAMKHSINPMGKSFAHLVIRQEQNNLYMRTENGNFPRKSKSHSSGIGLSTLKKRLDLLYKENFSFETRIENDNFIAELQINLKSPDSVAIKTAHYSSQLS